MNENQIKTLLFCKGWKQYQIDILIENISQRYRRNDEGLILFAIGRAHDLTADGKTPSEVVQMFAPERKES